MENDSKIIDAMLRDKELAGRMEHAFSKEATPQELAGILKDAGIEVEASEVEEIMARLQAKRGESIAVQELDDDELEMVAGGGDGICNGKATCDQEFLRIPELPQSERCNYGTICDEYISICSRAGGICEGLDKDLN